MAARWPMGREARGRRQRPAAVTPLIDIIFLLLCVMPGATFTRHAERPLMLEGCGMAGSAPPLFLHLRPDDVAQNGTPLSLETLIPALAGTAPPGGATLPVTLSGAVTRQRRFDLLAALRAMPGLAVGVPE